MKATFLKELPTSRDMLSAFGGYDGRARISEGTFADMRNLSSQHYPVMSTRRERAWLKDIEGVQGVLAKDKLAWVVDDKLYYNGNFIADLETTRAERDIVSMGGNIVIYPDQVTYNPVTGILQKVFMKMIGTFRYSLCGEWPEDATGKTMESTTKPTKGEWRYQYEIGKIYWYQYDGEEWITPTGDVIEINFEIDDSEYDWSEDRKKIKSLLEWTGDLELVCGTGGYYRFKPISINSEYSYLYEHSTIHIKMKSPNGQAMTHQEFYDLIRNTSLGKQWHLIWPPRKRLDGIFESGNRLWGYRYGENEEGEFVNEIYSTALGDPIAWDTFEGIASDSYTASVGSDGPFTGAIEYSGSLYFFKENYMHRLMGLKPSSYQISTLNCHGVEIGSERSLVCLGDALYYKGNDGIYCYDGSIPYRISDVFGEKRYKNAVGGILGSLVFMDMENEQGKRVIFVYDTLKRLWHIEESPQAKEFISAFGNLIYRTDRGLGAILGDELDGELVELFGEEIRREGAFKWFGEFGDFGLSSPDAKYVSKLQLRMTVDEGARVAVEVMTDSDGSWSTAQVISAQNKRSVCLPIVTPRCDHFRLRLSGEGGFKLWSLTKETESTNEVR